MKIIDLHGVRHKDVYGLLERSCTDGDIPFVVITGKSNIMKKIVMQIINTFEFCGFCGCRTRHST